MAKHTTVANTAQDPTIQFEKIELSGKTWSLCYDFNAIAEAEALTGSNLLQGMAAVMITGMSAAQLRALLYAALRKAHPKITLEDAGRLIGVDDMPNVREALLKTWGLSAPEKPADPLGADGAPAENQASD